MRREELDRRLGPGIVHGTSGSLLKEGPVRLLHPKTAQIQMLHLFLVRQTFVLVFERTCRCKLQRIWNFSTF